MSGSLAGVGVPAAPTPPADTGDSCAMYGFLNELIAWRTSYADGKTVQAVSHAGRSTTWSVMGMAELANLRKMYRAECQEAGGLAAMVGPSGRRAPLRVRGFGCHGV